MKFLHKVIVITTVAALPSCGVLDKINQPISGDEGFNPLDKPGTVRKKKKLINFGSDKVRGHGFNVGDTVEVAIANTAFYKRVPQPGDRYSSVLKVGESLKVVGSDKDFLIVNRSNGDKGYVSSVMVILKGSNSATLPQVPSSDYIAPEPEINGIGAPASVPTPSVPSLTAPVPVDPEPLPLPEPLPVPQLPDPAPVVPDAAPAIPGIAPAPELPSLPSAPAQELPALPELPAAPSLPIPSTPIEPIIPGGGNSPAPEPEIPGLTE